MAKKNKSDCTSSSLTIEFNSPEAANHFRVWLCEQGEQDYWVWMECREYEEKGDITAKEFNYHGPNPNLITTRMGRLTKESE